MKFSICIPPSIKRRRAPEVLERDEQYLSLLDRRNDVPRELNDHVGLVRRLTGELQRADRQLIDYIRIFLGG